MTNARTHLQGLVSLNNRAKAVMTGLVVGAVGLCLTTSPAIAVEAHAMTAGLGAPQIHRVSSDNGSITLDFLPPVNEGGSAIFGYQDSIDGGNSWQDLSTGGTDELTAFIGRLRNGSSYSVEVRAVSDAGFGEVAVADEVTPSTTAGAPTGLSAVAGDSSATVSFNPPIDNGGADILDYQYSLNGGDWRSFVQLGSMLRSNLGSTGLVEPVTGLTNGTTYSLRVRAMNVRGGGVATDPVSIAPHGAPFGLTSPVSVVPVGRSVTVAGVAPAGSTVQVYFRSRGQAIFTLRRSLIAAADSTFSTSYVATDDCSYYAQVGSVTTPVALTKVGPTVAGAVVKTVKKGSVVVESGTGVAGSTVEFHFHAAGAPGGSYSVLRDVVVGANGVWSRSFVASSELRFYVTSKLNNTATSVYLVHVH